MNIFIYEIIIWGHLTHCHDFHWMKNQLRKKQSLWISLGNGVLFLTQKRCWFSTLELSQFSHQSNKQNRSSYKAATAAELLLTEVCDIILLPYQLSIFHALLNEIRKY